MNYGRKLRKNVIILFLFLSLFGSVLRKNSFRLQKFKLYDTFLTNMASVIIADDARRYRSILTSIVRRYNKDIEIDEVKNGRDLVERVRTGDYTLVITDNKMPELNGLEATEQIRTFSPDISICMITSSDSYDDAMRVGVTDWILKSPNTERELSDFLSKYL